MEGLLPSRRSLATRSARTCRRRPAIRELLTSGALSALLDGALHAIGFAPERGNKYAYYLDEADKTCQARNTETLPTDTTGSQTCVEVDTFLRVWTAHEFGKPRIVYLHGVTNNRTTLSIDRFVI